MPQLGAPAQEGSGGRAILESVFTPASSRSPTLVTLLHTFFFFIPHLPHLVLHFLPHILPPFIYHHPMCGTISSSPTNPSCLRRLVGLSSKTFHVCAPSISRPHQHLSHNLQHFSLFRATYIWKPSLLEDRVWGSYPSTQSPEPHSALHIVGHQGVLVEGDDGLLHSWSTPHGHMHTHMYVCTHTRSAYPAIFFFMLPVTL